MLKITFLCSELSEDGRPSLRKMNHLTFINSCSIQCWGKTRSWLCVHKHSGECGGKAWLSQQFIFCWTAKLPACYCLGRSYRHSSNFALLGFFFFLKENKHIGVLYAYASHAGSAHACSAHRGQKNVSDALELKVVSSCVCARN